MKRYHVGAGIAGVYAGKLKKTAKSGRISLRLQMRLCRL